MAQAQLAGDIEYTDYIFAKGKDPLTNKCPRYNPKQSDGKAPEMLSTPSLPSLPGPLWLGVVTPDRVLSMGQIKLFDI